MGPAAALSGLTDSVYCTMVSVKKQQEDVIMENKTELITTSTGMQNLAELLFLAALTLAIVLIAL